MPLKRCSLGKTQGWKYGDSGKCYKSKKDAIKQGLAIEGPTKFKQEMSKSELVTAEEIDEIIDEMVVAGEIDRYDYYAESYISQKERDKMPSSSFGDPKNRRFPVPDEKHFRAAVKLLGRIPKSEQGPIKERLKKIALKNNWKLPSTWTN